MILEGRSCQDAAHQVVTDRPILRPRVLRHNGLGVTG